MAPHLARSWSWEDNRQRLTLKLRPDVRWHDSTPVRARDVVWTLRTAAQPEYGYPGASDFSSVAEVTAPDSATVVVRFEEPHAEGLVPFSGLPILPRHLLEELPAEKFGTASYHQNPVGSGPFRFAERRPDGSLVFERSDLYPEELGAVFLDRVVVRVIPAPRMMATEFRVGGVDACVTTSGGGAQLQKVQDLELVPLRPSGVQYIALNTTHAPFGDARVRRALSAALNRSAIASIVSPLSSPAGTPLPEGSPWISRELLQPNDDSALADSLLAAAGWGRKGGSEVRTNRAGEELAFTIVATSQVEDPLTIAQAQLSDAGVDVELRFMEPTAFYGTIRNPDTRPAAMALGSQSQSLRRPDFYGMLHSTSPRNLSGYGSPRLDSLLAVADTARDSTQLRGAYRGVQRVLRRKVPYIYTVYVPRGLAVGPNLRGVQPTLNTPLATVGEWWIPRARRR